MADEAICRLSRDERGSPSHLAIRRSVEETTPQRPPACVPARLRSTAPSSAWISMCACRSSRVDLDAADCPLGPYRRIHAGRTWRSPVLRTLLGLPQRSRATRDIGRGGDVRGGRGGDVRVGRGADVRGGRCFFRARLSSGTRSCQSQPQVHDHISAAAIGSQIESDLISGRRAPIHHRCGWSPTGQSGHPGRADREAGRPRGSWIPARVGSASPRGESGLELLGGTSPRQTSAAFWRHVGPRTGCRVRRPLRQLPTAGRRADCSARRAPRRWMPSRIASSGG